MFVEEKRHVCFPTFVRIVLEILVDLNANCLYVMEVCQMTQRMCVLVVEIVLHLTDVHAVHSDGLGRNVRFLDVMEYQQMTL